MRIIEALFVSFSLFVPAIAQSASSTAIVIPRSGIVVPQSSEQEHDDAIVNRAVLPCDGVPAERKNCSFRFTGKHNF